MRYGALSHQRAPLSCVGGAGRRAEWEGECEARGHRWAGLGDVPSGEGECDAQERGAPVGNVPSGEGECETHG